MPSADLHATPHRGAKIIPIDRKVKEMMRRLGCDEKTARMHVALDRRYEDERG